APKSGRAPPRAPATPRRPRARAGGAPPRRTRAWRRGRRPARRWAGTRSRRLLLRASRMRNLVEVVVEGLAAAFLGHEVAAVHLARGDEAERDGAPDPRVRRVADVRALGEAGPHAARPVADAHGPHAAAVALEADLEDEVDAARAVLAQHERQRLEDALRRGRVEAARVDAERL